MKETAVGKDIEEKSEIEEIVNRSPGVLFQFRRIREGEYHLDFVSEGVGEILEAEQHEPIINRSVERGGWEFVKSRILKEDLPEVLSTIEESAQTLSKWQKAFRVKNLQDEVCWVDGAANPVALNNGHVIWRGVLMDVTPESHSSTHRYDDFLFYEKVLNRIPVMIDRFDENGDLLYINKYFEERLGWSLEDIQKRNIFELTYPDEDYRREVWEYMMEESTEWKEMKVTTKSGDRLATRWSNKPLADGTWLGIGIDVSEMHRVEQMNSELGHIIDRASIGIYLCDPESKRFIYMNKGAKDNLQYRNKEDIHQLTPMDLSKELNSKQVDEVFSRVIQKGETVEFRDRHIRKDGSSYPALINLQKVSYMGRPVILAGVKDISKLVEYEEQLKSSISEKELMIKEINHRVKNNMQIISSLLNLQADTMEEGPSMRYLLESRNRVQSMAIAHEILYNTADLKSIEIDDYLNQLVEHISNMYGEGDDKHRIRVDADPVTLTLKKVVVLGLLVNELITNSLKHAFDEGDKGTIEIECRELDDQRIMLQVCDDGKGLPDHVNLNESDSLGMQIIQSLAGQLSDDYTYETDEERGGTRFKLLIERGA